MAKNACSHVLRPLRGNPCSVIPAGRKASAQAPQDGFISVDLGIEQLCRRLSHAGDTADDLVYGYVIDTVKPRQGLYHQTGSAPNWQGGLVTLCTCKHDMRATMTPREWLQDKWIAGLSGWNQAFKKQQSLIFLMRVGEAYASHAAFVDRLRESARQAVIEAKASTQHPLGDLMIPAGREMPVNPHDPAAYSTPVLGHAHRNYEKDDGWHNDIHHASRGRAAREAPVLAGDANFSFRWTHPMVRRVRPGLTRPYRIWTMTQFLSDIEAVPA